jgi:hypothetical protein
MFLEEKEILLWIYFKIMDSFSHFLEFQKSLKWSYL